MAGGSQLRSLRGFVTPRPVAFQLPVGTPRYHRFVLLASALKFGPGYPLPLSTVFQFFPEAVGGSSFARIPASNDFHGYFTREDFVLDPTSRFRESRAERTTVGLIRRVGLGKELGRVKKLSVGGETRTKRALH